MTHGSLFSGIGGFDLAAARVGWKNVFQIEIDPFCQRVLQKNFPDAQRFSDIREFDGTGFAGKIDVVSGGFPCQPFSVAGQRKGKNDDRALWHEMLRVIREIKPAWVVGENVAGIISMELDAVLSDLESIGYACQAFVVPACAVNALHRRDRVWVVANLDSKRQQQPQRVVAEIGGRAEYGDTAIDTNPDGAGREKRNVSTQPKRPGLNSWISSFGTVEWQPNDTSELLRAAYGLPGRVDGRRARIKALGNAIVPQVDYQIFHAIEQVKCIP